MVLLKEVDEQGFVFYSNYASRKAQEIGENPHAALTFYWRDIHRQVRVIGQLEKVSEGESVEYYNSRPLGSRIGAWASPQSTPVGEDEVQIRYDEFKEKYVDGKGDNPVLPKPEHWGGFRLIPT
jgi:pyridoxamine-phosphate oxidase